MISKIGDLIGGVKGKVINFAFKHIKKEVPDYKMKNEIPFLDFLTYDTDFDKPEMSLSDEMIIPAACVDTFLSAPSIDSALSIIGESAKSPN